MVLRQSFAPVAVGLGIGLVASVALARFVQALLFEVSPFDPLTLCGAAAGLAAVAALACALPARRASRISPVTTLRL